MEPWKGRSSAPRPWVRARLALPSLCSGLPLEAKSRSYTTILARSFCCSRWAGVEVPGCQVRWSRDRRDCGKEKPHFAVMKPLNWPEAWATGVTWSLCVSITKEKWSLRFFQPFILWASYSYVPSQGQMTGVGLGSLGYCLSGLSLRLWVWPNLNLTSGQVFVIRALNDSVL